MRAHWMGDLDHMERRVTGALDATRHDLGAARHDIDATRHDLDAARHDIERDAAQGREHLMTAIRAEYTVMPRFSFHQPLDYLAETFPPNFGPSIIRPDDPLPLPPAAARAGYPVDDALYLDMGRADYEQIIGIIDQYGSRRAGLDVLDFGCSSGRVLRHFEPHRLNDGWRLYGVDIQALMIEWLRRNFPRDYCVFVTSVMPHLPFPDQSLDVIYGLSVFTHIKFMWDAWLMELRRVLRPGGLLIQTIHSEAAWRFYYDQRDQDWVKNGHSPTMLRTREMEPDFLYYGDISVSQVFWKREIAREFWSRYFTVLEVRPPPHKYSFQDSMICRKD